MAHPSWRRVFLSGVLPLALAACDDKPVQRIEVYHSVAECQAAHPDPPVSFCMRQKDDPVFGKITTFENCQPPADLDCAAAFAGAQEGHAKSAPHYGTLAACEAANGAAGCQSEHGGGADWFIPVMAGFIAGHALGGSGTTYQPIYVDRTGTAYSNGALVGSYTKNCPAGSTDPACRGSSGSSGFGYVYNGHSGGSSAGASTPTPRSSVWSSGGYPVESGTQRGGFGASASSISKPLSGASHVALGDSSVSRGGFGATSASFASRGSGS